MPAVTLETVFG